MDVKREIPGIGSWTRALTLVVCCGQLTGLVMGQIVPAGTQPGAAPTTTPTPAPARGPTPLAPRPEAPAVTPATAAAPSPGKAPVATAQTINVNEAWLSDYAARSMARMALLDVRVRVPPSEDDIKIALELIRHARKYLPNDSELLRLELETASVAGDQAGVLSATRELVRLDPADAVAQLRLISARITDQQTVEGRLALYERFLGSGGESLDGSIRSRLALDAALLARENGNDRLFAERLKQALTFDSTNKEAALLALSEYSARVNSPEGRAQLISNLILADPIDPQVHRQFAQELARYGAYPQARRFLQLAERLYDLGQYRPDDKFDTEMWITRWAVSGGQDVLRALEKDLTAGRYQGEIQNQKADKDPALTRTDLNEIRLAPAMERLRVIVADAMQDTAAIEVIRSEFEGSEQLLLKMPQRIASSVPADQVAATKAAAGVSLLEYELLRLWFNMDVDKVPANVESALAYGVNPDSPTLKAIAAWQVLRSGKAQEALDSFASLQDAQFEVLRSRAIGDIEPARVGMAMALEALGRNQEAAEIYRTLATERSLDAVGLWAKAKLERMGGSDPERERIGQKLAEIADAVPKFVEDMAASPNAFMSLSVTAPDSTIDGTAPVLLNIKIRNRSKIMLGMGSDRPLNTQLLLQPGLDIQTSPMAMFASPEPVTLDRRFRLGPGETAEFVVWADPGYTGWLAQSGIARAVRQRFRVIQGFLPNDTGEMVAGPTCLTADSNSIVRNPLREAVISPADLAAQIATAPASVVPLLAAAARGQFGVTVKLAPGLNTPILETIPAGISAGECQTVAKALADRYLSLDPRGRIIVLCTIPNQATFSEMQVFDEMTKGESDDAVIPYMLITRVTDPADAALERALASSNPWVARVAKVHQERLSKGTSENPAKTLATLGMYPAIDRAAGKQAGKLDAAGEEVKEIRGGRRREEVVESPAQSK